MSTPQAQPRFKSVMVGFGVQDMDRAVEFYTAKLGFQVTFKNAAAFTIVSRDGIEIGLGRDRAGSSHERGSCYVKLENIDLFHEAVVRNGVEMTHPLKTESYGMKEFMITDPDGNRINFGEPA